MMTFKRARNLVNQYAGQGPNEVKDAVAQRMVDHGECLWHAIHVRGNTP